MADRLELFVLAGEPSGDRIGADLVQRLASRTNLELSGVGGAELEGAGLRPLFPMHELSVMGWADVLPRLPLLLWRVRQVAREILRTRPDVAVLIDSQVFAMLVARRLRRAGYRGPVVLYVAPAVWAWKPQRAKQIAPLYDAVLAVLPFEPGVMARLGGPPTTYVGHPALSRLQLRTTQPARGPLLLLPGSRQGELRRHLPLMREIAQRFAAHPAVEGFVLPTIPTIASSVAAAVADWPVRPVVIADDPARQDAFTRAVAGVAVTGTVTLELALAGIPMVTTYVADGGQARFYRKYRPRFAALPNIVLDRPLVPEILDLSPQPDRVAAAVAQLLDGGSADDQIAGFGELSRVMRDGIGDAPLTDPADKVLELAGR